MQARAGSACGAPCSTDACARVHRKGCACRAPLRNVRTWQPAAVAPAPHQRRGRASRCCSSPRRCSCGAGCAVQGAVSVTAGARRLRSVLPPKRRRARRSRAAAAAACPDAPQVQRNLPHVLRRLARLRRAQHRRRGSAHLLDRLPRGGVSSAQRLHQRAQLLQRRAAAGGGHLPRGPQAVAEEGRARMLSTLLLSRARTTSSCVHVRRNTHTHRQAAPCGARLRRSFASFSHPPPLALASLTQRAPPCPAAAARAR